MNKRFGNSVMTVLLGVGSAIVARNLAAEPVHPPTDVLADVRSANATASGHDARALMERDISAQLVWLTQQARNYGFADLQELLMNAPRLYARLAEAWRQVHPVR